MKYDVHIYAIVLVKVRNLESVSHATAIEKAMAETDLNELFSTPNTEFADDIDGFLVDEVGDEDFRSSKQYEKDGVTPLYPDSIDTGAQELLDACKELLNCIDVNRDWEEAKRARAAIAKATRMPL